MDRGHGRRTVLSAVSAVVVVLLASADGLNAQGPLPGPATTATPWVQASPPGATASPLPTKQPHAERQPVFAPPAGSPSNDEVARVMAYRREQELTRLPAGSPNPGSKPLPPRLMSPRLTPEDNAAYEHNLPRWQALPPEEKKEIRGMLTERIQEETEKAYANSGLNLNEDQRAVFALRYRQERRRLEREIQEKATEERLRRMPELMDRLRHEFGAGTPAASVVPGRH